MENYISADLTYIIDDGQPSIRYVDWPEEEHKAHIAGYEKRMTKVYDGRSTIEKFQLNRHGFLLLDHPTKMSNFYNEKEIQKIYYPETADLIKRESGGKRVYIFDHTVRTPLQEKQRKGWVREPG